MSARVAVPHRNGVASNGGTEMPPAGAKPTSTPPSSTTKNGVVATKAAEMGSTFELGSSEQSELRHIVAKMLQPGKGILAADDPPDAVGARLVRCGMDSTAENRRRYRQLLFSTPNLHKHISAIIIQDETYRQQTDQGERLVDQLTRQGIAVGVKIDADPAPLFPPATIDLTIGWKGETITQGLDGLAERAAEYKKGGCSFAKWRCAYRITDETPSEWALEQNAMVMARYAMICQRHGLVPIVEPDVNCEGAHSVDRCREATQQALAHIVKALAQHNVYLEGIVIKTNMAISGFSAAQQATPEEVAEQTLTMLRRTLPPAVPGVAFLSGGQTEVVATNNLHAINKAGGPTGTNSKPWQLTFCYGRALQAKVMEIWQGNGENVGAAQKQFFHRARANAEAEQGTYSGENAVASAIANMKFGGAGGATRYY